MREYFYQKFPSQLASIEFRRPNRIAREHIMHDDAVVFFGGRDWSNAQADLGVIPAGDRSKFVLSLFMIVLTDQALYTYYNDAYLTWRSKTNYPKFGWSGFGPHNENPFKILWAPERDGLIDIDQTLVILEEFIPFLINETRHFFLNNLPGIDVSVYFDSIRNDQSYSFSQGRISLKVKEMLDVASKL